MARFCARVRKRPDLPAVSIKDIYQYPTIRMLAAALADDAPVPLERVLSELLADVMQVERVSVDSNFFDDLGADSMVMARFCARVRKRPDLPAYRSRTSTSTPRSKAWRRHSRTTHPLLSSRLLRPRTRWRHQREHRSTSFAGRSNSWPFSDISLSPR